METYVKRSLRRNEQIVKEAELNQGFLLGAWLKGILFSGCF